ncbi:AAA family ATPase [Janthinobacterium agaricidamnosum]|uniref:ATPase n=1 Tax=Janthinobacterium agaricidamnosum NBRC 102515 = DSM 9628 TaxID=1349767 RepID=W0V1F7_9BURK|nr:AAA family ATPase [Janthinobacterium agaricidamnosum]CDG81112.1 ATPase [Janthinobacterium agaricidamnosum NBRC 102515 = DSM 9628]
MWLEEVSLENIKCFKKTTLNLKQEGGRAGWVTLLSENGGGKTTLLQSMALALAGPEVASQLLPRPTGWLRQEGVVGKISCRIHQEPSDSGTFGVDKIRTSFAYTQHVTGHERIIIRGKVHTQPGVHESADRSLSWLRQNAFSSSSKGWFAAGYGAFRRLTRRSQVLVPSMQQPSRFTNFSTQFAEDEGLATLENWLMYLDYQEVKRSKNTSTRLKEISVDAINGLLPSSVRFDSIDDEGRILFDVDGAKVPTFALSDGYRSVLALAGDLVWRLIEGFPDLSNPLSAHGVVLIDELDIHLHPVWQRYIATWLQEKFPNIQFIVSTHSPFVAAGAGRDALTLKIIKDNESPNKIVHDVFALDVDDILKSDAFDLTSTYAPEIQDKLNRYEFLMAKRTRLTTRQKTELSNLSEFFAIYNPYGIEELPSDFERKINNYMAKQNDKS